MTSENFNKIMLHPLTLLLIFGILLVFFSVCCLKSMLVMAALEASWNENGFPFLSWMLAGGRGAAQFVRARPWTWFSTWQRASRTFGCTAATAPSAV